MQGLNYFLLIEMPHCGNRFGYFQIIKTVELLWTAKRFHFLEKNQRKPVACGPAARDIRKGSSQLPARVARGPGLGRAAGVIPG